VQYFKQSSVRSAEQGSDTGFATCFLTKGRHWYICNQSQFYCNSTTFDNLNLIILYIDFNEDIPPTDHKSMTCSSASLFFCNSRDHI